MMQSLGRTIGKLRRVATDLREQSGIDDILRAEGIEKEVRELHKLATGRILDVGLDYVDEELELIRRTLPPRSREYPRGGVDTDGVLPDDASPYAPLPSVAQGEAVVARGALLDD